MSKPKGKGGFFITAIVLAALAIPAAILSYVLYFAWDNQLSGEFYKPAFEKDGQLYDLNLQGNSLAFDSGTGDDHLYLNSFFDLSRFIALSYDEYEINKTGNPYFAGSISFGKNRFYEQETKYRNAKDSYQSYKFYDQNRNLIFAYEPETENEFIIKLRPTFPVFAKRKYSIGNKRDYVDATGLLKAKLDKSLKIRVDEANKLLIIRFEN